jgi:hypothetical protein
MAENCKVNDCQQRELRAEIERLMAAIRSTATEGTYDEMAIRKAVSFELAELIVEARAAFADLVPQRVEL